MSLVDAIYPQIAFTFFALVSQDVVLLWLCRQQDFFKGSVAAVRAVRPDRIAVEFWAYLLSFNFGRFFCFQFFASFCHFKFSTVRG